MLAETVFILASFTAPEQIGTTPQSTLWLLPLVAAIVIGYKVTKVPKITFGNFVKEISVLFGTIVVFMAMGWLNCYRKLPSK